MVRNVSSDGSWDWEEARKRCLEVARRYARRPGDAEDIAQNAVLRAWRNRDKLRDGERRSEWLAQIARNEALRELDRRVPEPTEEIEHGGEEDERLEGVIESAAVQAALARLSDGDREIILLRYESDLTQSAIAERLGIPEGTVKIRLHRARDRLRKGPEIK